MKKQTALQIVKWCQKDVWLKDIATLYQQVWNIDSDCMKQFQRHMGYEGFKGYIILNEAEKPCGFTYGYASLSGQYYHELLANHLKPDISKEWLTNCFEFVELCVHPSLHQQSIGSLLHDQLLEDIQYRTSVLTTQQSNLAAQKLYDKNGWSVIDDSFFPNKQTMKRYLIYGKKLI